MKLELTLGIPDHFVCKDTGLVFTHTLTGLGSGLHTLTEMWGMSATEIIERLVNDAVIKEEEEGIVDGEYHPPIWAKERGQTKLH